jgi:hypothetical protein
MALLTKPLLPVLAFGALAASLAADACVPDVPLDGRPCPCSNGWVCCPTNVCAVDSASCPSGSAPGSGGAGGSAGTAGSAPGSGGAGGSAGTAGGGIDGTAASCAVTIDFHDGMLDGIQLGPRNAAFLAPTINGTDVVVNYEFQSVFDPPMLETHADFPRGSTCPPGNGPDPWLGELSVLPAGCQPASLVGRTVRVTLMWLRSAASTVYANTVSLGTYSNGAAVDYADATIVYPLVRTLDSLDPLVLEHTFVSPTDGAEGVYLRIRLQSQESDVPTTVYIDRIEWGKPTAGGTTGSGVGGASGASRSGGAAGSAGPCGAIDAGGAGGLAGGGQVGGSSGAAATGGTRDGGQSCLPTLADGGAGTSGPGGQGGAGGTPDASCGCAPDLVVEVRGDGAPLALTSGDPTLLDPFTTTASGCVASAPPWAESTSGELYQLRKIQACAGPGGQPPCLLLQAFNDLACGFASTYTDRSGNVIHGNVVAVTNWTSGAVLTQSIEGNYAILLADGRPLSGHLLVCLLAQLGLA